MDDEFIELLRVEDYVDGWRLAAAHDSIESFDRVLQDLNLKELEGFSNEILKPANSTIYFITTLSYHVKKEEFDSIIVKVMPSERYLNLMAMGVRNLGDIYLKDSECDLMSEKLKKYISYARSKDPFASSEDKRLLKNHIIKYMGNFSNVRDFLMKKDVNILKRTEVVLSLKMYKNES